MREVYRRSWWPDVPVAQIVRTRSRYGVLRGMHVHKRQSDVWHIAAGTAQVQTFDHRTGEHRSLIVEQDKTLVIPPGVSHGWLALRDTVLMYGLTEEYDGTDEYGWYPLSDEWPGGALWRVPYPTLSERDQFAPTLEEFRAKW